MKVSIGRLIVGIGFYLFCGSAFWLHTQTENPFFAKCIGCLLCRTTNVPSGNG